MVRRRIISIEDETFYVLEGRAACTQQRKQTPFKRFL
jgi:hypothetical protein